MVASVGDSGIVRGISTGSATFTFTDTSASCYGGTTPAVTVDTFPNITPITSASKVVCIDNTITLNCSTVGGTWSLSNTTNATIQGGNMGTSVTIYGVASGTVSVTYTVGSGVCQSKSTFLLKVEPPVPVLRIGFEE